MNKNFKDEAEFFGAIFHNPQLITYLPATYKYDKDFLEIFYIILGDKIAPYIPYEILKQLKNKENNFNVSKIQHHSFLENEEEILHNILQNPQYIENLPTNEKYNDDFLEMLYIIWEDEIEPYIPKEMFEWLKNEHLMKTYHEKHNQEQQQWINEIDEKIKLLSK